MRGGRHRINCILHELGYCVPSTAGVRHCPSRADEGRRPATPAWPRNERPAQLAGESAVDAGLTQTTLVIRRLCPWSAGTACGPVWARTSGGKCGPRPEPGVVCAGDLPRLALSGGASSGPRTSASLGSLPGRAGRPADDLYSFVRRQVSCRGKGVVSCVTSFMQSSADVQSRCRPSRDAQVPSRRARFEALRQWGPGGMSAPHLWRIHRQGTRLSGSRRTRDAHLVAGGGGRADLDRSADHGGL